MTRALLVVACLPLARALKPTLHAFEHCHFSTKARLVLGWAGVEHELKFYGYGAGADPDKCEGFGYQDGPSVVPLTGSKVCPVFEHDGAIMTESSRICSLAASTGPKAISHASGRGDVARWLDDVKPTRQALERPRLLRMPVPDFADERDIAYSRWTHERRGFSFEDAEARTPELLEAMEASLVALDAMLEGDDGGAPCLNAWGLGMDDALVLPILRSLTVVDGIRFGPRVSAYLEGNCDRAGVPLFSAYAS